MALPGAMQAAARARRNRINFFVERLDKRRIGPRVSSCFASAPIVGRSVAAASGGRTRLRSEPPPFSPRSCVITTRRQPWQTIRQKGGHRTGLVLARAKTTKCAIGLKKFGVTPEQLKAAVRKVGNSAKAVEKELKVGVAS